MTGKGDFVLTDAVSFEVSRGLVVARVNAREITYPIGETLCRRLVEIASSGWPGNMVLDLSGLQYLSSTGLNVILLFSRRVTQCCGQLAIAGLHGNCLEVMKVVGLTRVFDLYPDADTAVKGLCSKLQGLKQSAIERRCEGDCRTGQHRRKHSPAFARPERRSLAQRRQAEL